MFDIYKVEAQLPCQPPGADEVLDNHANLSIGEHGIAGGQTHPPIQDWVVIQNARLGPVLRVRAAVTPRIGQLQANQQAIIRTHCSPMFLNQRRPQARQAFLRMLGNQKLIWIRAPVVTYRDRLPSPD